MVGEELTNFQSKVHSIVEGDFSTVESTCSKQKIKGSFEVRNEIEQCGARIHCSLIEDPLNQISQQKVNEEASNRLFTFMDEKDYQKKLVQNLFSHIPQKHKNLCEQNLENNQQMLNLANVGIQKITNDSNDQCLFSKKSSNKNSFNKQTKSMKKISNLSKSKTARIISHVINKDEAITKFDVKNQLKTEKISIQRSLTPKYDKQKKFFGSTNQPKIKCIKFSEFKLKKEVKQKSPKKQRYEIKQSTINDSQQIESIKKLLKKRKQLEKQLMQINSSLLCKKKKKGTLIPPTNRKSNNLNTIKCKKKSTEKLLKPDVSQLKRYFI